VSFPHRRWVIAPLVEWLQGHGELDRVGVEGTGTDGAGLARHLREEGMLIVEVDRLVCPAFSGRLNCVISCCALLV
jgi:hypothetical protein